ncbi:MAG: glycogen/starch synthase [Candidatus Micrarchaeia archaeon]
MDYLFEISSEAGRKIGGIYTVLRSKSAYMKKHFGDNYTLIGYYEMKRVENEFEPSEAPRELAKMFSELSLEGINCFYGNWIKGSNTNLILVDAKKFGERLVQFKDGHMDKEINFIKFFLWEKFGIDSLGVDSDFTEYVTWAYAAGMLLERISKLRSMQDKKILAHFHEWLSGAGLLYLKAMDANVATIFTTHATTLGRTMSFSGRDTLLEAYNSRGRTIDSGEAYRYAVQAKHLLEVACAKNADVFTTVSDTVSIECEYILGKKPDVVTLNGFDFAFFEEKLKKDKLAKYVRQELLQFLESYFMPYYIQSYKDAIILYISGRYEFTNKGFDILIGALGKLNKRVQGMERRLFAFIFAPSNIRGPKPFVISNYLLIDKIEEMLTHAGFKREGKNLQETLKNVDEDIALNIREMVKNMKKIGEKPPISCFELDYPEENDSIISACIANGLTNSKNDAVKVIFYPAYLTPGDGLLSMTYYDLIGGTDVGVFPSRYEPFGLTPVEAGSKENIAITSDMTGFGRFIMDKVENGCGIKVIRMLGRSYEDATNELADYLFEIYKMPAQELERIKKRAFETMRIVDWKYMVPLYLDAYKLAIRRKYG